MNCFAKYPAGVSISGHVAGPQTVVVGGLGLPCGVVLVGRVSGVLAGLIFTRPLAAKAVAVLGQETLRVGIRHAQVPDGLE